MMQYIFLGYIWFLESLKEDARPKKNKKIKIEEKINLKLINNFYILF